MTFFTKVLVRPGKFLDLYQLGFRLFRPDAAIGLRCQAEECGNVLSR